MPTPTSPPRPVRVLLVEDHDDSRAVLARLLRMRGCEVAEAADGPTALGLAPGFAPDLVIVDLVMPGMGGYELLRRLRDAPGLGGATLAAYTASLTPESALRAWEAGAAAVPPKRIDVAELIWLAAYNRDGRGGAV